MYEEAYKRIIKASQNHSLSFFVGAGVSSLSGAPSWKKLIQQICEQINQPVKDSYSSDENLRIPQIFYHSINRDDEQYYRFIEQNLIQEELSPNAVHKALLRLNPISFITTNFDDLLETAAIQYCQSYISVACDNEVGNINGDKYILKLHGDLKHRNIVFKEEDYLNYSENFKLMETLLKSIFSTNTVVFIGYGLNDYNIKLVLNWAKSLLKDHFNKPIFIYTDSSPLSKAELLYHESRGLYVIDCTQIAKIDDDYLPRYMTVLNAITKSADFTLEGKTPLGGFNVLYQLLKPLDKLQALRFGDVTQKLSGYAIIGEGGEILANLDDCSRTLFQRFYEISFSSSEYTALDEKTRNEYDTILSVLEKAQIYYIRWGMKPECFAKSRMFADPICLHFDYATMRTISFQGTVKIKKGQYAQAFYLFRLKKYDQSYFLFAEIAREAFKSKDYLLYYLCEINCINLEKIIKNSHKFYGCYSIEDVDDKSPSVEKIEKIFEGLPIEFQNQYENFKDLYSANLLYKYSYEAFVDGLKLQKAVESNSTEFGLTSSQKVTCRINDYIHFLLGNGIIADVFSEYRNTVKNLMDLLTYKYSEQQKKTIHPQPFPLPLQNKVYFDDVDFYCFIEYFTGDEIARLFSKNQLESIKFEKIDEIEKAIHNILCNYKYLESHDSPNVEILSFQTQIKTLLVLLRYMDISQECVDSICEFILNREFGTIISISDKILFLDRQIARRNMRSDFTSKIIEEKLIQYLDMNIKAIESGNSFALYSSNSAINYYNLVYYIYLPNEFKSNHALCLRVSHIMGNNLQELFPSVVDHYWEYLSQYMKKKILRQAKCLLKVKFDFNLFKLLIWSHAKFDTEIIKLLKDHLHAVVQKGQKSQDSKSGVMIQQFPAFSPYEDLESVGYWCLLNILPRDDFLEFVGISDTVDFYLLYNKFDFTKFNVSWLLNLNSHALEVISKNKQVKQKIRKAIASILSSEKISKNDEIRITKILTNYFC